jgi:hypothetical protein
MTTLNIFISSISVHDDRYYYHGDGTGDFEKIAESIDRPQLLYSYKEHLEDQLAYIQDIITNEEI